MPASKAKIIIFKKAIAKMEAVEKKAKRKTGSINYLAVFFGILYMIAPWLILFFAETHSFYCVLFLLIWFFHRLWQVGGKAFLWSLVDFVIGCVIVALYFVIVGTCLKFVWK